MTRLDWWIGVVLVVFALLAHAMLPRYQVINIFEGRVPARFDRWTGILDRDLSHWSVALSPR